MVPLAVMVLVMLHWNLSCGQGESHTDPIWQHPPLLVSFGLTMQLLSKVLVQRLRGPGPWNAGLSSITRGGAAYALLQVIRMYILLSVRATDADTRGSNFVAYIISVQFLGCLIGVWDQHTCMPTWIATELPLLQRLRRRHLVSSRR